MGVALNTRTAPTKRTLALLAAQGYLADVAERRQGPITIDLFGCMDIVAVHPTRREILFVQVTSRSHRASRVSKVLASPHIRALLKSGALVQVWAWDTGSAEPSIVPIRLKQPAQGAKEPTV